MTNPLRLLLVEDSPDDAELLRRHLHRDGLVCDVERVETAEALLAALQRGPWDAVVSDYRLPRFSGPESVQQARAFDPWLPVIIVSGTAGEDIAADVMRAGARDFILKDRLARLAPALRREVAEAKRRREQRAAEERIQRREAAQQRESALMLATQEIAHAGAWDFQARTGELFFTEGLRRLLEVPLTTEPSLEMVQRMLSAEQRALVLGRTAERAPSIDLEVKAATFTGRDVWLRLVARVEYDEAGTLLRAMGAVLDVTERRVLETQVLLKDRLIAMGTISAGVAHEINNPLTHLVASLPLAIENLGERDAELSATLQDCLVGAQRIAAIVRDLKVFTRPDEDAHCEVATVLTSVLNLLNLEYRHAAEISRDVPTGLGVAVPSARVAQVLTNLIINAVQAMPQRPARENRVLVRARDVSGWVHLEVQDNGAGMSDEVRGRLFSPFFTTKPVGRGTGLGLSVCRQVARAVGGDISVDSTPGVGTTFLVKLPRAATAEVPAVQPVVVVHPARALRLLVIDDEPTLLKLTARLLKPNAVVALGSADEALELLLHDRAFDAVLCDLMMPGRSGVDFHQALRERGDALAERCLFVSGGAVTRQAEDFLQALGPRRVLLKPYTLEQLREAVDRVAAESV